jgi:hypothetical protein
MLTLQGAARRIKSFTLGKEAEARVEAAEVLRLNPQFSLEVERQRSVWKDPVHLEHHIAALRKARLK